MNKEVAVIILNWNGWRYTSDCLISLKASDVDKDVIVIDNQSTDSSPIFLKVLFPLLNLIESGKNGGFAFGNNIGILKALEGEFKYIWFLNNDTLVYPNTLPTLIRHLNETGCAAVSSVLYNMDSQEKIQELGGGYASPITGLLKAATSYKELKRLNYLTAASMLVRRDVLEHIGLLDQSYFMYWEDVEFSWRLQRHGYCISVAQDSKVLHKGSASTTGGLFKEKIYNKSLVNFIYAHSPTPILTLLISTVLRTAKRLSQKRPIDAVRLLRSVCEEVVLYHKK